MVSLLQILKPQAGDEIAKLPKANVDIRWPGMSQDWQYTVDTPGISWREYGLRRRGGSFNPRGPTDPTTVQGFIPYSLTTLVRGEREGLGTPQNLEAPRPFTQVSPHPPLDLRRPRWEDHTGGPDIQSPALATSSSGGSLPKHQASPSAWNPHFERIGALGNVTAYQDAPPTMSQYAGTLVAERLTPEEFKAKAPQIQPGDKGTLIVHGTGFGLFAKAPLIRDYWADRFLAEGLRADRIEYGGTNDFVVRWSTKPEGMRIGPIAIGVIVVSILLVLGWLAPRLTMFLEKGVGGGFKNIGLGVAVGALGLAFLASRSQRGII